MPRIPFLLTPIAALVGLGVTGCGSNTTTPAATPAGAVTAVSAAGAGAPETLIVDDATVTAGLTRMPATIAAAIAAIGTPDAGAKLQRIETEWLSFEGTVKSNDPALYLAIEDQLLPLQTQIADGDAGSATKTATSLSEIFATYLAKFP